MLYSAVPSLSFHFNVAIPSLTPCVVFRCSVIVIPFQCCYSVTDPLCCILLFRHCHFISVLLFRHCHTSFSILSFSHCHSIPVLLLRHCRPIFYYAFLSLSFHSGVVILSLRTYFLFCCSVPVILFQCCCFVRTPHCIPCCRSAVGPTVPGDGADRHSLWCFQQNGTSVRAWQTDHRLVISFNVFEVRTWQTDF